MRILFPLCALLLLSACASGARPERMVAIDSPETLVESNHMLYKNIALADVRGGKETNPLLASKVGNAAFQKALQESLEKNNFLAGDGNARYVLEAELLALEQPLMGFSFTVDSVVDYGLVDNKNKSNLFKETIKAKGTATMGDSLVGVERLRISNEYSIKNNIKQMLEALASIAKPTS